MAYPSTPTSLYISGTPAAAGKLTKNTNGTVAVSAVINDPDSRDKIRMVVRYSSDKTFKTYRTAYSAFGRQGVRHGATMTGLVHEHAVLRPGLHPAARPDAALEALQRVVLLDSCVASIGPSRPRLASGCT